MRARPPPAKDRAGPVPALSLLNLPISMTSIPTDTPIPARPLVRTRSASVRIAMLLSGFAGLAYQTVWTHQLGIWLGHEFIAVAAVVAAFFGGFAVGSLVLGRIAARHPQPGRLYAVLEVVIALWALILLALLPGASAVLLDLIGPTPSGLRHWLLAFAGPFLLLLPATAAMGATLPALAAHADARRAADGRDPIGGLYAVNTLGAVLGVLATAFWLAPTYGLAVCAALAITLNLACAALAWSALGERLPVPPAATTAVDRAQARATLLRLALGGWLAIGYEVLAFKVASRLAENTVYTVALLLAVWLAGTALGAALWQRRALGDDPAARRTRLAAHTLIALLAGGLALEHGTFWLALPAAAFGISPASALGGEALLALAAVLLPTMAMGALFAQQAAEARAAGVTTGRALAVNTLGAMLAAPGVALLLVPSIGAGLTLLLLAAGYLLLLAPLRLRSVWPLAAAGALLAALLLRPALNPVTVPAGGRIVSAVEGIHGAVSVTETADGHRILRIDNHQQEGATPVSPSERREAWLPLLLHPAPTSLLLLGLGTGGTAIAAAADPALDVTAVELLPEVVAALPLFTDPAARQPQVRTADARRHVRTDPTRHDVIVADLFHPARGGTASLYTVEHYAAVRERLADGGLFVQWLPLHQLDLDSLRAIVAACLRAFPDTSAVLATHSLDTPVLGLVGSDRPLPALAALDRRLAEVRSRSRTLDGLQFDDALSVAGSVIADAPALRRFAGAAAPNRDAHPIVAYRAPWLTYAADSAPRDRLLALIAALDAAPTSVFGTSLPADDATRLAAYWRARDAYLAAGRSIVPRADPVAMLDEVGEPLLRVLAISPEFAPAYDPLLRLAQVIAPRDPANAADLLTALIRLAPQRSEAAAALAALSGASTADSRFPVPNSLPAR